MELTLKNFRCYETSKISLSPGVTLIDGVSGVGKSTIFDAIYYVLFNKLRKPYTHGKKKCSVRLDLTDNIWIQRQSGPHKLEVHVEDQKYIDDVAQGIIHDLYGTYDEFLACCYMQQSERHDLLTGTNENKLNLIRSISLGDDNVNEVKVRLKDEQKKVNTSLQENQNAYEKAVSILGEFDNNNQKLKAFLEEKGDAGITELQGREVETLQKDVEMKQTELAAQRQELQRVLKLEANLEAIKKLVGDGPPEVDESQLEVLRQEKASIEEKLVKVVATQKVIELQKQQIANAAKDQAKIVEVKKQQEQKQQDLAKLEATVSNLTQKVAIDVSNLDAEIEKLTKNQVHMDVIQEQLKNCEVANATELAKKIEQLTKDIIATGNATTEMEMSLANMKFNEEQETVMKCPKCETGLRIEDFKLYVVDGTNGVEKRSIAVPDATPQKLNNLRVEHTQMMQEKDKTTKAQKVIGQEKLAMGRYREGDAEKLVQCKELKQLLTQVEVLKKDLATLSLVTESPTEAVEESSQPVPEVSSESAQDLQKRLAEIGKSLQEIESLILRKQSYEKHQADLQKAQEELGELSSATINEAIAKLETTLQQTKDLLEMVTRFERRIELKMNVENLQPEIERLSNRAQGVASLISKAKQVERSVLDNTVVSLNLELKRFLDVLFVDDTISIEFRTYKQNKTGKNSKSLSCSLSIFYKNVQLDDYKSLSGGEIDRISLAMLLAMNSLKGSNIILLDESLHSINESLKIDVVEVLKNVAKDDKVCAIIAHETIGGVYDHVISL